MNIYKRVIPCILIQSHGMVKTINFKNPKYLGDPLNAVKVFNEKEVDELIILDIDASKSNNSPDISYIRKLAEECFMPLAYGGGITKLKQIEGLLTVGIEKVAITSHAVSDPKFIYEASKEFGTSTIIAGIDFKRNFWGKSFVYGTSGMVKSNYHPLQYAKQMEEMGAGELLLNSIDRDGTMTGYDIETIKTITNEVNIPVVACGGAGNLQNIKDVFVNGNVDGAAAGSLFIYQGKHKAVLINYSISELNF